MSTNENSLELLREQLDATNLQLLELLSQRAELVGQLGKLKEAQGVPDFDPVREQQMLDKLIAANRTLTMLRFANCSKIFSRLL